MKILLAAALLACAADSAAAEKMTPSTDAHRAAIEQWQSEREGRLRDANGWLTLVGLHWLEKGWHTVGTDPGNDITLAVGPARLGRIGLVDDKVRFEPLEGSGAMVEQPESTTSAGSTAYVLAPDSAAKPSVIRLGAANFVVIERSGRFALRVKDPDAATRTRFAGIDRFPIDAAWRFDATFEPHPAGKTIEIANVVNMIEPMANPGAVVFRKDGKRFRLEAVDEGDGQLFLIFADRTNGKQTYGPGRFLYADKPVGNRTVVDFNRAYNPPCAFNEYSTCPLPPPENRLDLAVTAGELKYAGPDAH